MINAYPRRNSASIDSKVALITIKFSKCQRNVEILATAARISRLMMQSHENKKVDLGKVCLSLVLFSVSL